METIELERVQFVHSHDKTITTNITASQFNSYEKNFKLIPDNAWNSLIEFEEIVIAGKTQESTFSIKLYGNGVKLGSIIIDNKVLHKVIIKQAIHMLFVFNSEDPETNQKVQPIKIHVSSMDNIPLMQSESNPQALLIKRTDV